MKCSGVAVVEHSESKQKFDIESNAIEWEYSVHERSMGPETHHYSSIDHSDLGQLVWNVWEYPMGVLNYKDHEMNGHKLVGDFDYNVSTD